MANVTVRKEDGSKTSAIAAAPPERVDPWRAMRQLLAWDPFGEMAPFVPQVPAGFMPAFEIKETKDAYLFRADVPGVKESDLEVTCTGNRLTVSGKRDAEKQEQTDTYYSYERSFGDFKRSFTLPDGVDMNAIHADLKDGVLTLSVHKRPEAQPKKIPILSNIKKG